MTDELKPDCYECGGSGRFCPSIPDMCDGCEDCVRCNGAGVDPGTPHPVLTGSVADPARRSRP